jgi:hypothetical protein
LNDAGTAFAGEKRKEPFHIKGDWLLHKNLFPLRPLEKTTVLPMYCSNQNPHDAHANN